MGLFFEASCFVLHKKTCFLLAIFSGVEKMKEDELILLDEILQHSQNTIETATKATTTAIGCGYAMFLSLFCKGYKLICLGYDDHVCNQ